MHGFFYAATDGVLAAAAADAVPADQQGTGIALAGSGQALERFECSLGFGAAWAAWGGRAALNPAMVGLVLGAATAAAVLRPTDVVDEGSG